MVRRRWIVCSLVLATAGLVLAVTVGAVPVLSRADASEGAIVRRVALGDHHRMVALTFDDGPDPRWTPQVLPLLARYRAHATFFVVGRNALARPDLVCDELATGNEVGDHTYDHANLRRITPRAAKAEIERGARAISSVGAPSPVLFRPPYGSSDEAVAEVGEALRYRTIFWNLSVERFANHVRPVPRAVDAMLRRVRPGTIILAHDGGLPDRSRTIDALSGLLAGLRARGYRVVDVSVLLAASGAGSRHPHAAGWRPRCSAAPASATGRNVR